MRGVSNLNVEAFDAACMRLRSQGFDVVSPSEIDYVLGIDPEAETIPAWFDYSRALLRDLDVITTCTIVAMLPGWEESSGAKVEREFALALGLEVLYL